ncbi:cell division protein FtsJ [Streptomyces sp. WAC 06783]|uniref:SAM-dependent methyltransferase n=1 Tax=Streptomyces sp. WAC 06783 TaxID=2203211 RepID=UPI000F73A7DD|nr:SAM-dependent methyltransferase [Streptomyces sp. WAC 06783]RSO08157.1 cell division protein FtsJ [Streptomyces sp. WAC 06783]
MPTSIFSTSEEYLPAARRELTDVWGKRAAVERLGPDVGALTLPDATLRDVSELCRTRPVSFVKHLTAEIARVPVDEARDLDAVTRRALAALPEDLPSGPLAVQAWVSGQNPAEYGSAQLFRGLADALEKQGFEVVRSGAPAVLSACITRSGVLLGIGNPTDSLSDWPGGRVRLSRSPDTISRAEFKLEEAIKVFGLDLPRSGVAADLGASPGGWTRILRTHGLKVWAVDPGDIDPRLLADPGVHHARTTAGNFFASNQTRFDVVVNDMKMDPRLTCDTMLTAAQRLRPGGTAVVTLKLAHGNVVEVVHKCLARLRKKYEILHARQLHHNRHEVTVVARLR